ncbi:MAG: ChaN family lipoprotein [Dichotomicrobium sp.]
MAALRLIFTALALICACAAPVQATEPWRNWQTSRHVDRALAGMVWDTEADAAIAPAEMIARLAEVRFVLIGEIHDNPDHHRLQGWIIAELAAAGMSPTVVMEMIARDKADALADYLARPDASAGGLGAALDWSESGWPNWRFYQPIAEAALAANLTIAPGNPPADLVRSAARNGSDSLPAAHRRELALDQPLPPALADALTDELYDGHCELMPRERLAPMARVQRLRDAYMADALLNAEGGSAVLIAGNGHVRADRGVPWYLRRRAPDSRVATVTLVELNDTAASAPDYVERGPDGAPVADFVWLTPRAQRPDPCEQMRQRFQKEGDGD